MFAINSAPRPFPASPARTLWGAGPRSGSIAPPASLRFPAFPRRLESAVLGRKQDPGAPRRWRTKEQSGAQLQAREPVRGAASCGRGTPCLKPAPLGPLSTTARRKPPASRTPPRAGADCGRRCRGAGAQGHGARRIAGSLRPRYPAPGEVVQLSSRALLFLPPPGPPR